MNPAPLRILACPAFNNKQTNPYNYLLYSNMQAHILEYSPLHALTQSFNVLHLHWPEHRLTSGSAARALLSCLFLLLTIDLLRIFKHCTIVWTVHNILPHETRYPRLQHWYYKHLIPRITGYIALSPAGETMLRKFHNLPDDAEVEIIPHGHYRSFYPSDRVAAARRQLAITPNATVILFFGQLRDYKNIPALISAFRDLPAPHLRLVIAGSSHSQATTASLSTAIAGDPRISLHPTHISDHDIQLYMGASNLVVLPYTKVLNSGSALLALSFKRPILVPDLGAMRDLQSEIGSHWVRLYQGDLTAKSLETALEHLPSPAEWCDLRHFDWPPISQQTLAFFKRLANHNPPK